MSRDELIVERVPMKCTACTHQWQGQMLQNVVVKVWVAYVRSLRCPACGADSHHIRLVNQLPALHVTESEP